jgi:2-haloacid dehalogenase
MKYATILWDLDRTLLDTDASIDHALEVTLSAANVADLSAVAAKFRMLNDALWDGVERGEISPNEVKTLRFEQLVDVCRLDADPLKMATQFADGIGLYGNLFPGALALLTHAASVSDRMAMVTNGIGSVQRARLDRLGIADLFSATIISGEVGTSKPGRQIFDLTFEALDISPDRTVMIGDSLTSDIAGAANYGIDSIWLNRDGRHPTGLGAAGPEPTFVARSVVAIADFL